LLLIAGSLWRMVQAPGAQPALAASESTSTGSFKVTFGLKQKNHGKSWAGVLTHPEQVRSIRGWHLDTADRITPPARWDITLRTTGGDTPEKAVILEVVSPPDQPVTIYTRDGDFSFRPAQVMWGAAYLIPELTGDVSVERVPAARTVSGAPYESDDPALLHARDGSYWLAWVGYKTIARRGYSIDGGDQIFVAHSRDGSTWAPAVAITPVGDHFRVALAEDGGGRVWCVYGLQKKMESGNFDLYARSFDGRAWSAEQQLTTDARPDVFHRMVSDRKGNLYLVWMALRPQSAIMLRVFNGQKWGDEVRVSESAGDAWEPAVATDSTGRAWIAWDEYSGIDSYDVRLRSFADGALGETRAISATPYSEMHADVAVDGSDRVWISWEEGGPNWGKDFGYENAKHRIHLRPGGSKLYGPANSRTYLYRRPRVAVLEGGRLTQPAAGFAAPEYLQANLFQNPRLGIDGSGRAWVFLRHQFSARGRNAGHLFDFYATTLAGKKWTEPVLLPASTGRQDTVPAAAPGADGRMLIAVNGDGRMSPVPLPLHNEIAAMMLDPAGLGKADAEWKPFAQSAAPQFTPTHPREAAQVAEVRDHRVEVAGKRYKIIRGDLHRHTEISMDGATDGTLWDFYRYALDCAAFDYSGLTDHNYGAWLDTDEPETKNTDDVYQWWRTQKSADIFYVPGRFVPLYGYERSINFPLGHRNIFHVKRGVFSLRVPKLYVAERAELLDKDAKSLWTYLRATNGVGLPHTSGTSMGTDWKRRNDALEPVTEIYQGDRNSYEDEGAPRAALPDVWGPGSGGRPPYQRGLVSRALQAGARMGFIASSDHDSTHISYANLLVPDNVTTRADIQEALRSRRTYASTDNIVVDFYAGSTMQGGEITAQSSPAFQIAVEGTEPILRVEVIKNNHVVYTQPGAGASQVKFSFTDTAYGDAAKNYYYVRVLQSFSPEKPDVEGEVAWSSPIFVHK
jgi:Protein of unknown function (DUF3604)